MTHRDWAAEEADVAMSAFMIRGYDTAMVRDQLLHHLRRAYGRGLEDAANVADQENAGCLNPECFGCRTSTLIASNIRALAGPEGGV